MGETYKVLKFLDHPCKSTGPYADIILVKPILLVNNAWFAVPYLDDVYVRKSSGLHGNVNQEVRRGMSIEVSRTTSTRVRSSSPDMSQKGARSSESPS